MTIPITGITLEGYQVFDQSTYIPLDRLTITFGPNSAGKSALQDAIALGEKLLTSRASKFDISNLLNITSYPDPEVVNLIRRHWRRQPGHTASYSPTLKIAIHHSTSCLADQIIADRLDTETPENQQPDYSDDIDVVSKWNFYKLDTEDDDFSFQWDYELHINSEFILGYIGENFSINLAHPLIKNIPKNIEFKEALKRHPEHIEFKSNRLTLKLCVLGFQPSAVDFNKNPKSWLHYSSNIWGSHAAVESDDLKFLRQLISQVGILTGCIIQATQGNTNITLKQVAASRTTPSPEDLVFELGHCYDQLISVPKTGDENLRSLATSLASKLEHKTHSTTQQGKLAEDVNRSLSDHLFIDQGYQLDFDYRVLLSKYNSEAALNGYDLLSSEFGYVVQLFVKDNHGRRHRIDDVGSGIGYLLPVLSATHEAHWASSICTIQQPELHIHPALQANLGDVFVEASNHKQLIIETHSEHLLLRILKRIRQTYKKDNIANELKIQAKDVCILYFNPSPEGFTSVKQLRISHDGEFMDRWPRGFFDERDQDLLDE